MLEVLGVEGDLHIGWRHNAIFARLGAARWLIVGKLPLGDDRVSHLVVGLPAQEEDIDVGPRRGVPGD